MTQRIPISVLDQSPVAEGTTSGQALRNSVDLARHAERLGFHRYWVAEHHGSPGIACAAPEALIGHISSATRHMRVGSGGIMLPHYSPLKVAETFTMLAALAPGRIDLGVGRASGTDPMTTFALQRDRRQAAPDDFPDQLAELLAYLDDTLPEGHPFARLAALPGKPDVPEPWLLGSSPQSGIWAAQLGLPYAFADFINPNGATIARRYRTEFAPCSHAATPRTIVAVWALCADTHEEAERLSASSRMMFTLLRRGELIAVPTPEKALAWLEEDASRQRGALPLAGHGTGRRWVVGTPAAVREGIERAVAEYQADEAMVVTITHDHAARVRSYELIAVPTPEKALAWLEEDAARQRGALPLAGHGTGRRWIVGTPASVREGIERAVAEYQADEAMVVTITHDHAARVRSYELIAREFGLEAIGVAA